MRRLSLILLTIGLIAVSACDDGDTDDASVTEEEPTTSSEIAIDEQPAPTHAPTPETETAVTPTPDNATVDDPDDGRLDDHEEQAEIDDDSTSETTDSTDEPFGDVPDVYYLDFHDQELSELLLRSDQMPEGWNLMVEGSLPEDAEATHGLGDMMSGPCGSDLLTPEAMGQPTHVGRHFIGEGMGPFFGHDLFQFDDDDDAEQAMEVARAQLDCDDWTHVDPDTGIEMQYSLEVRDLPELGDDRAAVALSITPVSDTQSGAQPVQLAAQFDAPFGSLRAETAIVRQGNVLSMFTYLDWFGDGELHLEEVVADAVEQIGAAQ
jgi:hypothetical protein